MNRRNALKRIFGSIVVACPSCLACASALGAGQKTTTASSENAHLGEWGYSGAGAPEHWSELSADYQACNAGSEQSPINLEGAIDARLRKININYAPVPLQIVNNGHTIQCNCESGAIQIDKIRFKLTQFHFHHPSEHLLRGKKFPLEIHFVHVATSGAISVLGVFVQQGKQNTTIEQIWNQLPKHKGAEQSYGGIMINLNELLPKQSGYFRYFGSLTTPPCSEIVTWSVFRDPIEMNRLQIEEFANIFPNNARSVQPLNRRHLLLSN